MRNVIAIGLLSCSLVTAAVTPRADTVTGYTRMSSPQHGWNLVVTLKVDGEVAQMLRYNPDKTPGAGREYDSEASCKQAIDSDQKLKNDLDELRAQVQKIADGHPENKFELQVGCMRIDDKPESF